MAKLISALKFRGSVDDLSFRLTDDGVVVQSKPGPTAEQVKNGKSFDLTRRNASEFGRATKDAMLIRRALNDMVHAVKHSKLNSQMNKRLLRIAKSDKVSTYGSRHADAGNIQLLEGFEYNHLLSLDTALPVQLKHSLDAVTGVVRLTVPGCIVRRKKAFPEGATHFRIVSCAGAVDFNLQRFASDIAQSELLPLSRKMPALQLAHSLEAQAGQVMLHTAGIVFYKVEDGEITLLRGGALKIVQVTRKADCACRVSDPGLLPRFEEADRLVAAAFVDSPVDEQANQLVTVGDVHLTHPAVTDLNISVHSCIKTAHRLSASSLAQVCRQRMCTGYLYLKQR